mmetsp:Transcript_35359/g.92439  ORF Transcript_35359/g.92439 Transcript_35359/m.92439 type:complete len:474 (-) Transcript_35359:166-1587(-)
MPSCTRDQTRHGDGQAAVPSLLLVGTERDRPNVRANRGVDVVELASLVVLAGVSPQGRTAQDQRGVHQLEGAQRVQALPHERVLPALARNAPSADRTALEVDLKCLRVEHGQSSAELGETLPTLNVHGLSCRWVQGPESVLQPARQEHRVGVHSDGPIVPQVAARPADALQSVSHRSRAPNVHPALGPQHVAGVASEGADLCRPLGLDHPLVGPVFPSGTQNQHAEQGRGHRRPGGRGGQGRCDVTAEDRATPRPRCFAALQCLHRAVADGATPAAVPALGKARVPLEAGGAREAAAARPAAVRAGRRTRSLLRAPHGRPCERRVAEVHLLSELGRVASMLKPAEVGRAVPLRFLDGADVHRLPVVSRVTCIAAPRRRRQWRVRVGSGDGPHLVPERRWPHPRADWLAQQDHPVARGGSREGRRLRGVGAAAVVVLVHSEPQRSRAVLGVVQEVAAFGPLGVLGHSEAVIREP